MSDTTKPHAEGERRKDHAFSILEPNREPYILQGRHALLRAMLDGDGTATADDVRAGVELPPGLNPKLFGPVPSLLAKCSIIQAIGYRPSTRPDAHARPIKVWRLIDEEKARRWMAAHPEPHHAPADSPIVRDVQPGLFDDPLPGRCPPCA